MTFGLQPKHLVWIIPKRLAASERPGGQGKVHRRVRRDEELAWIKHSPITRVLSLLGSEHNIDAYAAAGILHGHVPVNHPSDAVNRAETVYQWLDDVFSQPGEAVLVHLDEFDDILSGLLGGYLVHSGKVPNPPMAVALIERITSRPMGPEGRSIVFAAAGGAAPPRHRPG